MFFLPMNKKVKKNGLYEICLFKSKNKVGQSELFIDIIFIAYVNSSTHPNRGVVHYLEINRLEIDFHHINIDIYDWEYSTIKSPVFLNVLTTF